MTIEMKAYVMKRAFTPSIIGLNMDVNNLKTINDTLGHEAGDRLLIKAAKSIRAVVSDNAKGFRMGGDEFFAIIPNTTQEECKKYIDSMNDLSHALLLKGKPIDVSFGYCEVQSASISLMQAMDISDKRMYMEKGTKKAERKGL